MSTNMNSDYPLFVPPAPLSAKKPAQFTDEETQAYFDWLLSEHENRVTQLARWCGQDVSGTTDSVLIGIGETVARALKLPAFSCNNGSDFALTNQGYALAADMGLLFARLMIRDYGPEVHWTILRTPKSDVSFNCPVLVGFGRLSLDPIQLSISQAFGVLRGNKGGDCWLRVFNVWKNDVSSKKKSN